MKTAIYSCKNKYGYTKRQLKIDYDNRTYKIGNFTIGADKTVTSKLIDEKINELKILGFKEGK